MASALAGKGWTPRQVTRLSCLAAVWCTRIIIAIAEESRNGTSVRSTTISQRVRIDRRAQGVAQRFGVRQVDVAAELDQHRRLRSPNRVVHRGSPSPRLWGFAGEAMAQARSAKRDLYQASLP